MRIKEQNPTDLPVHFKIRHRNIAPKTYNRQKQKGRMKISYILISKLPQRKTKMAIPLKLYLFFSL